MSRSTWRWIDAGVILAVHDRQIAEHGGLPGIRNPAGLSSALARAQNLAVYGNPDAAELAAAYGAGITKNHPFADGNKRTAWVAIRLFLADNGYRLNFDPRDAVRTVEGLAGSDVSEKSFAQWLREKITRP